MDAVRIAVGEGLHAIVDSQMAHLKSVRWHLASGYAFNSRIGAMHRYIVRPPEGLFVDHINGNRLDNRLCNLRVATAQQNQWNRPKTCCDIATSKYKGVQWCKQYQLWRARIRFDGTRISLGYFKVEEEAARAYDMAARVYHGEFARTNF